MRNDVWAPLKNMDISWVLQFLKEVVSGMCPEVIQLVEKELYLVYQLEDTYIRRTIFNSIILQHVPQYTHTHAAIHLFSWNVY